MGLEWLEVLSTVSHLECCVSVGGMLSVLGVTSDRKESCSGGMASSIAGSCYATGRGLDNSPTHFHHFIFLIENHLAVVIDFGSLGTCNFFLCADNQSKEIKEAKKN